MSTCGGARRRAPRGPGPGCCARPPRSRPRASPARASPRFASSWRRRPRTLRPRATSKAPFARRFGSTRATDTTRRAWTSAAPARSRRRRRHRRRRSRRVRQRRGCGARRPGLDRRPRPASIARLPPARHRRWGEAPEGDGGGQGGRARVGQPVVRQRTDADPVQPVRPLQRRERPQYGLRPGPQSGTRRDRPDRSRRDPGSTCTGTSGTRWPGSRVRPTVRPDAKFAGGWEEAYAGIVGGGATAAGTSWQYNVSYGLQSYCIAGGMLLCQIASSSGERAGDFTWPRWSGRNFLKAQFRLNNTTVDGFHFEPNDYPNSHTRIAGVNLQHDRGYGTAFGFTWLTVLELGLAGTTCPAEPRCPATGCARCSCARPTRRRQGGRARWPRWSGRARPTPTSACRPSAPGLKAAGRSRGRSGPRPSPIAGRRSAGMTRPRRPSNAGTCSTRAATSTPGCRGS